MSAADRLDEIQARYVEWHQDRGDRTPAPDTDVWPDADHPDESMEHCIVRNDVPAMYAALQAFLDLHKPTGQGNCVECTNPYDSLSEEWPCPTVLAVESSFPDRPTSP